jgi:hypothetical protein
MVCGFISPVVGATHRASSVGFGRLIGAGDAHFFAAAEVALAFVFEDFLLFFAFFFGIAGCG